MPEPLKVTPVANPICVPEVLWADALDGLKWGTVEHEGRAWFVSYDPVTMKVVRSVETATEEETVRFLERAMASQRNYAAGDGEPVDIVEALRKFADSVR